MNRNIIYSKTIPKRDAIYVSHPYELASPVKEYLLSKGVEKLYCHQAEMFDLVTKKKNVVITTSTASGKTLSFLLPIVQEIIKDPHTRALFIYPTKALANDQYRAMQPMLEYLGKNKISAGVYDGDTPVNERSRIRNSANIILTNPEMLNSAFLPNHSNYGFDYIFSNLKFIVIDELHSYKGAFGSHLSNVFRRLKRICKYYNSSMQFLCSSATIANPIELAENICGVEFTCISRDGSPAPEKIYNIIQPPKIKGNDFRVSITNISTNLLPELIMENRYLIAFCKSRSHVEVVLKETRDKLKYDGISGQDMSNLISGYRGGYTPLERMKIESQMVSGNLRALVSTNALELGIDIGKIDTTVITGYPGTKASFWQQSGRAGRAGKSSETFLILDDLPFDQFIAIAPEWLFEGNSENAVIDRNNLFIQIAHLRAAAAEMPLSLDDVTIFPDLGEILPVLIRAGELKSTNGKFVWCGAEFPAGDYGLRNMDTERYKLVDSEISNTITEMDEMQAFSKIHNGAIYIHDGRTYQILNLDLTSKTAIGKASDDNYYTEPYLITNVTVIKAQKNTDLGRTKCYFGDVKVTTTNSGFKKIQFHNHQNLGFEKFIVPLSKTFETEGVWIIIPNDVCEFIRVITKKSNEANEITGFRKTYFYGISYAIYISAMMTTMTTNADIGFALFQDISSERLEVATCIYDLFVGGLGFAEKANEVIGIIVQNAIKRVDGCSCKDGCPVCVGDHNLDRKIVLWALKSIFNELVHPLGFKIPIKAPEIVIEKPFVLVEIRNRWPDFIEFIKQKGEYLSDFISTIKKIEVGNNKIILFLENEFYKNWIEDADNMLKLRNMLSEYINVPLDFIIDIDVIEKENYSVQEKVNKRFTELTK